MRKLSLFVFSLLIIAGCLSQPSRGKTPTLKVGTVVPLKDCIVLASKPVDGEMRLGCLAEDGTLTVLDFWRIEDTEYVSASHSGGFKSDCGKKSWYEKQDVMDCLESQKYSIPQRSEGDGESPLEWWAKWWWVFL